MTTVSDIGEFGLLAKINTILRRQSVEVLLPFGDDCIAVPSHSHSTVFSSDAMVEGSHFDRNWMAPEDLAWKSLAGAVSDLAAKGAKPAGALITLGLPGTLEAEWILTMYETWVSLDQPWSCPILGGDTVRSPIFFVDVFVWGAPLADSIVPNHMARPGDGLYVTGTLGDALAGLRVVQDGRTSSASETERFLLNRFFRPVPRVAEIGSLLSADVIPTAMSDISDGLARTVRTICERSQTGALIRARDLPLSKALRDFSKDHSSELAWEGGEDYELLLTLAPADRERALSVAGDIGLSLSEIGEIRATAGDLVVDGLPDTTTPGFDHFS